MSFIDLPGELRSQLYDVTVLPKSKLSVIQIGKEEKSVSRLFNPTIFRLNRGICYEAITWLCEKQTFLAFTEKGMEHLLDAMGPAGRRILATLCFTPDIPGPFDINWMRHLLDTINLRTFTIDLCWVLGFYGV